MSLLRRKIESIFHDRINEEIPNENPMKGHDIDDRDSQPGVTIACLRNEENPDFPPRSGVYKCELQLIVESNVKDLNNTQESLETKIVTLTDAIEDLAAVKALCAANYQDIHVHEIFPSDNEPEREDYNLNNTYNYEVWYEFLNV